MSQRPLPPRGMRDVLPVQARRRRNLQQRILDTFESFGFEQIETPMLEEIDRLLDSEAGDNAKLIYKVLRRGIDWPPASEKDAVDLGLRYDLTVPLARFFATNQAELPQPFKSIQIGPAFRAERPQKGRYRQFTQCDIDVLGDASPIADAELVVATLSAIRNCGLDGFSLRMNSRELLDSLLRNCGFAENELSETLVIFDKLDKLGLGGVEAELNAYNANAAQKLIKFVAESDDLSAIVDERVLRQMQEIEDAIKSAEPNTPVKLDISVVRGQGYYTGPVFEVMHAELGGTLAGGGRYDNMIKKLSGIDVPATGMSIGFERLDSLLEAAEIQTETQRIVLLHKDANAADVISGANQLRAPNRHIRTERAAKNQRAQLERLSKAGFTHFVNLGESEVRALGDTK